MSEAPAGGPAAPSSAGPMGASPEEPSETIAVYGGSFDPPHIAHALVAAWVLGSSGVDRMIVVPTFDHPLKQTTRTPYRHRIAMAELAFAPFRRLTVSRIEEELEESRTLYTLEALTRTHPSAAFRLVIGADILAQTGRWHRWDEVVALAPPLVVGRQGYPPPGDCPVELPDISSTDLRARLSGGRSVRGRMSPEVVRYAMRNGLYGNTP